MSEKIEIIKALGDKNRYRILQLLLNHNYCVRALSKKLNISEAGISQHLKILREAGLVWGEKRGYFTHYMVNREVIKELANDLIRLCENDGDEDTDQILKLEKAECNKESESCKRSCHNP